MDSSNLKQRVFTAIFLVPMVLAIIFFFPAFAFLLLTAFITLAGAWEWSALMGLNRITYRVRYVAIVAAAIVASGFVPAPLILAIACVWWCFALILVIAYPKLASRWSRGKRWRGVMGIVVLIPCWEAINFIRMHPDGAYALLFLFILIWGADTAAYFIGKQWGARKLAPQVSPGKSIEGVIGALFVMAGVTFILLWLYEVPTTLWSWAFALSLLTILFSILGDLFESMLKRQAGVKDSGQLLPGHGGLLDRIDSLTAAAPLFALGQWLIATKIASF